MAQATRARVSEAAHKLLLERGYARTTIEAIAHEAGVGLRTVYDMYGSKSGILRRLLESFAEIPRSEFESTVQAQTAHPDQQLRVVVDFVAGYFAAAEPLLKLLRTSAHADPALQAAESLGEELRRESQRAVIRNWRDRGVLRSDLTSAAAADILWAMTSPSLYWMLVQDRRWSRQRYRAWLHRSLRELLFGQGRVTRTDPDFP